MRRDRLLTPPELAKLPINGKARPTVVNGSVDCSTSAIGAQRESRSTPVHGALGLIYALSVIAVLAGPLMCRTQAAGT